MADVPGQKSARVVESRRHETAENAPYVTGAWAWIPAASVTERDFGSLVRAVWYAKWIIVSAMILGGAIAFAVSFLFPITYRAEATLAPASGTESAPGINLPGQLGGLANIAGISLGGTSTDRSDLALAVMESRDFVIDFIVRHELLVPLFAGESWDANENSWILDPDVYDSDSGVWVRDVDPPRHSEPSLLEAYQRFVDNLTVEEDPLTGIVKVAFFSSSPAAAKDWLEALIRDLNSRMREEEVQEAQRRIEFLSQQAKETSVAGIQQVLYQVIADQMQKKMLAESREEYAFKIVDPPVRPEVRHSPKRLLIAALGMILMAVATVLIVVVRLFAYSNANSSAERGHDP